MNGINAPWRDQDQRQLACETRTVAQILAGDIPGPASGAFWPEQEVLLCRAHFTPELLRPRGDEPATLMWGFCDCHVCFVEADASDVAIKREEDILAFEAALRALDAAITQMRRAFEELMLVGAVR